MIAISLNITKPGPDSVLLPESGPGFFRLCTLLRVVKEPTSSTIPLTNLTRVFHTRYVIIIPAYKRLTTSIASTSPTFVMGIFCLLCDFQFFALQQTVPMFKSHLQDLFLCSLKVFPSASDGSRVEQEHPDSMQSYHTPHHLCSFVCRSSVRSVI